MEIFPITLSKISSVSGIRQVDTLTWQTFDWKSIYRSWSNKVELFVSVDHLPLTFFPLSVTLSVWHSGTHNKSSHGFIAALAHCIKQTKTHPGYRCSPSLLSRLIFRSRTWFIYIYRALGLVLYSIPYLLQLLGALLICLSELMRRFSFFSEFMR